jgi:hypothetical protein
MHDCRNEGLRVERAHYHGIFGLSDYHQERTVKGTTTPDSYTPKAVVPNMWLS